MRIRAIHESTPDERAKMHEKITAQYLSNEERAIIKRVYDKIMDGGSQLKPALADGHVSMIDVINAIKNKRCIGTPTQDLGSTYLENVIGNVVSDLFQGKAINIARRVFGMHAISPSEKKEKKQVTNRNLRPAKRPTA